MQSNKLYNSKKILSNEYLYKTQINYLPVEKERLISKCIAISKIKNFNFNVIKLTSDLNKVSFLSLKVTLSASGRHGSASTILAVPLVASGDVIIAFPPNLCTSCRIASLSVMTKTSMAFDTSNAFLHVCSMSVQPVSARSILFGSR